MLEGAFFLDGGDGSDMVSTIAAIGFSTFNYHAQSNDVTKRHDG